VYVEGVDHEAFLLLDRAAIEHASAALDLRIHPVYADAAVPSDPLPDLESMHVQWDSYLSGQDLTGYERNRLRDLGNDYLVRAVDEAT
jgi:hypothetical protein